MHQSFMLNNEPALVLLFNRFLATDQVPQTEKYELVQNHISIFKKEDRYSSH